MKARAFRGLVTALVLALTVPAAAQQPKPDAAEAVALARGAKERYDQGNWTEALTLFEQAEAKAHSPVLLLYAARCHRNLGHLVRAREVYQRVATEQLAPNAPEPFKAAQRDAKGDLEALEPRIGRAAIDRKDAPSSWSVEIDGAAVSSSPVLLDPGPHVLVAKDAGTEKLRRDFLAREGETIELTVGPASPRPNGDLPPNRDPVKPEPPRQDAERSPPPAAVYAPGIVLVTLGAGGLAAGIATRVIAFQKVSDVKDRCDGNVCRLEDKAEIESAETFQTVSTGAFAVGGAMAATGIVLVVVLPMQAGGDGNVSLRFGPGSVTLTGTF